jgi:lysophospholipase L1-like esterase
VCTAESTYKDESKRLLVIGDSLVLSIGCKGTENAHLLTQIMASTIAKEATMSIEWKSLGLNGAGVDVIHDAAMNYLRRQNRRDSSGAGSDTSDSALSARTIFTNSMSDHASAEDQYKARAQQHRDRLGTSSLSPLPSSRAEACVIFCGLNDFKRLWRGRTAGAFRRDLKRFLIELRGEVGPDCVIFLPALPLEPTQFPEPLRTLVIHLGAIFDSQKERIAAELPGVVFLAKPERAWWRRVHRDVGDVIAEDGVHPNERGYTVYGRFLGSAVARYLIRAPA